MHACMFLHPLFSFVCFNPPDTVMSSLPVDMQGNGSHGEEDEVLK